jgi:hypothetical protein
MFAFGIFSLLDFFMVAIGMGVIFQTKENAIFGSLACYAVSIACLSLRLCLETLWRRRRNLVYKGILYIAWVIIAAGFCASFAAVGFYIVAGKSFDVATWAGDVIGLWKTAALPAQVGGAVLLLFLVFSPIFFSFLFKEHFDIMHEHD